jgi:uncharacterized protein (DUF983 family)
VAAPSIGEAGLGGLCPRCGAPTLFSGPLLSSGAIRFADRCRACGLDFTQFNVGDGPAAFLTLILGTLVTILAVVVEIVWHPPLWVHAVVWLPLILASTVWTLRLAKGALLAAEYRNAAREGRVRRP